MGKIVFDFFLKNWKRYSSRESLKITKHFFSEKFSEDAPTLEESETGLKNFSVIDVSINEIEWLYLASQGHRRILFKLIRSKENIEVLSKWLAP